MNPSQHVDHLIAGLTDWRGKTLANIRKSIRASDPEIIEEWKWMGSPVWSRDGIIAVAHNAAYLQSTLLSCAAAICHLPSRFNQASVQTWHCFASGRVLSLPMECSLP